jgi:predicted DNA-binding transcriptional regulator YafY
MRVNRLLEMTTLLLKRKTIPAREFAERFQVSIRTVYRDVEDLSSAGVPVFMTKGKGGGISLLDTFTLDKTLVSDHEIDSLLLALKTLQATQYPEIDQFLAKLEALFQNPTASDWVHIEFAPWGSRPDEEHKFVEIKQAILARRRIQFDYVDARGEQSRRAVEPMRVIFKSQAWYLWGYCLDRQDFRTFRLSRMKEVRVSGETFVRREPPPEPQDRSNPSAAYITARLRFSSEVLHRVYDDFNADLIVKNPDGSCQVTVRLAEDEWVYGFLLSYGCFVEVLEPEHLRKILTERMKKAIQLYDIAS